MYLITSIKEMNNMMKYIILISLFIFGICVWMDSTPSQAVHQVSNWISDVSNEMEGGFND